MDDLLNKIMKSSSLRELQSITRAMDRLLMAGRYVIPIYHNGPSRIAHKSNLKYPDKTPLYGDRIGFFLMYGGKKIRAFFVYVFKPY